MSRPPQVETFDRDPSKSCKWRTRFCTSATLVSATPWAHRLPFILKTNARWFARESPRTIRRTYVHTHARFPQLSAAREARMLIPYWWVSFITIDCSYPFSLLVPRRAFLDEPLITFQQSMAATEVALRKSAWMRLIVPRGASFFGPPMAPDPSAIC